MATRIYSREHRGYLVNPITGAALVFADSAKANAFLSELPDRAGMIIEGDDDVEDDDH
jgi:hypothetical protein